MKKNYFLFFFLLISGISFSQIQDTIPLKNGIDKPSMLPIHHFGLFSARINQNFKVRPEAKSSFNFSFASGNTFHPFVEMYLPENEDVRQEQRSKIWFNRQFQFKNQETTPAEYSNIVIDAVFKNLRIEYTTKIAQKHELQINLRSYLVTKGKYPFSLFTSDESIEWFHSNIAGGEDAFGRRYYGLNQVNVKYQDRNGRVLVLKNGEFIFAGIELNHYYYPTFINLNSRNIFINFGSHLGLNTSKYNPSLDIGVSTNIIKKWTFNNTNEIRTSFGSALLRKNFVSFNEAVDLGNNKFLGSVETMLEFTKYTKKGNYNAISLNFQMQTRFHKKDEANYYQLVGKWQEIKSGWQNGFEQLYHTQSTWTWLYTHGRKNYSFSIYIKEDLLVNNAPDLQTGISLKIPILKK
ncbi:hypothetical protein [Polaribacter sp.]|uniref:hypothetical protein n=1 Tax=Polaribacter sp. TaxID=1920175 RepID=UPI003EF4FBB4